METNAQRKNVTVEAADVYTIQHSSGIWPTLSVARCAASLVAMRVKHGITIYKNGVPCDHKRF